MANFDVKKWSHTDKVIIGAGALAFLMLFFPWYGVSTGGYSYTVGGFSTSYGLLADLLIVAASVWLVLDRADVKLSIGSLPTSTVILALSLVGTVLIALRWLMMPSGSYSMLGVSGLSYGPSFGIIIAIICGIVQSFFAFRMFQGSKTTATEAS